MTTRFHTGVPYSFRVERGEMIPVSDQQSIVADILRRRERGWSLGGIAWSLNERGIPPKRGVKWYKSTVRSVIRTAMKHCCNGKGGER